MSVDNDDRFWRGDYSPIFGIALVLPCNCRVATDKRVELITAYVPNHICFCHHASKRSKKEGTFLLHREHGSHIFRSYKPCEYHKLCVWIVLAYLHSRVSPLKSMRDHEIIAFVCACSQYRFYFRNGNIINTRHVMAILRLKQLCSIICRSTPAAIAKQGIRDQCYPKFSATTLRRSKCHLW